MSSLNLVKALHSVAVKDFAKQVLAATKQLVDEGAAVVATADPAAAPIVNIAQPLADSFFDVLVARLQHLADNQHAKEAAVAAVAEPAPSAAPAA